VEGLKNRLWAIDPPTAGGPLPAGPSNYGGNSAQGDPIRNDNPPPLPSSGSPGAAVQCPYNPPILEHAIAGENPLPQPKKSCGTATPSSVTYSGLATSTPSRPDPFPTVQGVLALPIMLLRSAIPTSTLALPCRNTYAMPPYTLLKPRSSNSYSKVFLPEKRKKFFFSRSLLWRASYLVPSRLLTRTHIFTIDTPA
jgi:hypothetical protein